MKTKVKLLNVAEIQFSYQYPPDKDVFRARVLINMRTFRVIPILKNCFVEIPNTLEENIARQIINRLKRGKHIYFDHDFQEWRSEHTGLPINPKLLERIFNFGIKK